MRYGGLFGTVPGIADRRPTRDYTVIFVRGDRGYSAVKLCREADYWIVELENGSQRWLVITIPGASRVSWLLVRVIS